MTTGAEFSPAYRAAAASENVARARLSDAKRVMAKMMADDEDADIDAMVRNMQAQAKVVGERTRTWREAYDALQKEEA